jgi:flagellar motor switch protein FliM
MDRTSPEPIIDVPPLAPAPSEIVSQSEIEKLLAQVGGGGGDSSIIGGPPPSTASVLTRETVRRHEFPKLSIFSDNDLRPLRLRHEDFISSLAARLSIHLGLEIALQMSKLEAMPFQTFTEALADPTYLSLLKLQPLNGTALLDIPPRLALSIVDRVLGGPGKVGEDNRQIGKIETRLLSPVVALVVNEWCAVWKDLMEIRPNILGSETNSRFLNTCAPATTVLVIGIQLTMGEIVDQMQIAFPHPMLEPLTVKLNAGTAASAAKPDSAKNAAPKWGPLFDSIQVEVRAQLPAIELEAGEVAHLKLGDVLAFPNEFMSQVQLVLSDYPGYVGSLGTCSDRRAVKIERCLGS